MIYLRPADRLDGPILAELRAASLVEMGLLAPAERDGFVAAAECDIDRLFHDHRVVAWVTCDDEAVVGSASAVLYDRLPYPEGSLHAEVAGVYVSPAYRRNGYAAEMVSEVVASVRASGVRKTFLRPSPGAHDLYVRLGFVDDTLMTLAPAARQ